MKKVLEKFSILNVKPVKVPLTAHFQLSLNLCPKTNDKVDYTARVPNANVIGCLMYTMVCTKPNISQVVSVVSTYMANLGKKHWNAVKWIFRYLVEIINYGLLYDQDSTSSKIVGYVD